MWRLFSRVLRALPTKTVFPSRSICRVLRLPYTGKEDLEWRISVRTVHGIVVKINSLGFSEIINLTCVVFYLAVVHDYRWFRTLVFCPGLNENSSLPEISSPLCYGGSTEEDYHRACQPLTPVCGGSPGAMHTRLS